jgi:hypothetical protein
MRETLALILLRLEQRAPHQTLMMKSALFFVLTFAFLLLP